MAFSTFGTGMGAVAQGMSFQPDWNAETNRVLALTQQMQNFYNTKMQIADKIYEATKPAILENQADSEAYNEWLKPLAKDNQNWVAQNPDYLTNPDKYAQWHARTDQIRNNAITQRAEQFKKEKEISLKFIQEHPDMPKSQRDDMLQRMSTRAAPGGYEAYQRVYHEPDYTFKPPKIENAPEIMDRLLAGNRKDGWNLQNIDKDHVIVNDYKTNGDFDAMTDQFMAAYPDVVKDIVNERSQYTPEIERKSEKQYIKDMLISRALPNESKSGQIVDLGESTYRWATHNETVRHNQAMEGKEDWKDKDMYLYNMQQGNGTIRDEYVTDLIPGQEIKSVQGDGKGSIKTMITGIFNGSGLVYNGSNNDSIPVSRSIMNKAGINITYPKGPGAQASMKRGSNGTNSITFNGTITGSYATEEEMNAKIKYLPQAIRNELNITKPTIDPDTKLPKIDPITKRPEKFKVALNNESMTITRDEAEVHTHYRETLANKLGPKLEYAGGKEPVIKQTNKQQEGSKYIPITGAKETDIDLTKEKIPPILTTGGDGSFMYAISPDDGRTYKYTKYFDLTGNIRYTKVLATNKQ